MQRSIGILAVALALGIHLFAQQVATDTSHNYKFAQPTKFAIKVGTPWEGSPSENDARQAVAKRLSEKGWTEADQASCDVLVVLHGTTAAKQTFPALYDSLPGYSYQNVGAPGLADSDDFEYKPGTLLVDIFDAKTKRAIFRGVAKNELTAGTQKKSSGIDKTVKKMFKDLPASESGQNKSE